MPSPSSTAASRRPKRASTKPAPGSARDLGREDARAVQSACASERPSGELGPEEAKEFGDPGKYGGKEHTQKGAERAERRSQIHVLVVSAENGGKQLASLGFRLSQGSFRNTGPAKSSGPVGPFRGYGWTCQNSTGVP